MKKCWLVLLVFFLHSCSQEMEKNEISLPPITTPTDMYPTSTPTTAPGPFVRSEPMKFLSMVNLSSFFREGIPVINNGYLKYYPLPGNSKYLWDYDWKTDALAYSKVSEDITSCEDIVTGDLHIHDYRKNSDYFVMGRVSSAKWSPAVYPGTNEHLLAVEVCRRQLAVFTLENPDQVTVVSENADPWFTWSPDGMWIAYVNDTNLIVVPSKGGPEKVIRKDIPWGGSVFDEDTWIKGHNVLLLAGNPVLFVDLDSLESFVPADRQGKSPQDFRGMKFLWDDETHTLIVFGETPSGDRKKFIFALSEDLHTIVEVHRIEPGSVQTGEYSPQPLVGWWVVGESFITMEKRIWSVDGDNHFLMMIPEG